MASPAVNGRRPVVGTAPFRFELVGKLEGRVKLDQTRFLLRVALADGEQYGVETPPEHYDRSFVGELECALPAVGLDALVRVKGRFGVFEKEKSYPGERRGDPEKTYRFERVRFVVESVEAVALEGFPAGNVVAKPAVK